MSFCKLTMIVLFIKLQFCINIEKKIWNFVNLFVNWLLIDKFVMFSNFI